MKNPGQTLVICVGNPMRSDDGLGHVAAQRLRQMNLRDATVREESGEGAALIDAWKNFGDVIVIDAAQSGGSPGTIHRLDATRDAIPSRFFHYSTHAFSVAEAVELARSLNQLPPRLILFGIEGRDFGFGEKLSPEVAAAVDELLNCLRTELQRADERPITTKR